MSQKKEIEEAAAHPVSGNFIRRAAAGLLAVVALIVLAAFTWQTAASAGAEHERLAQLRERNAVHAGLAVQPEAMPLPAPETVPYGMDFDRAAGAAYRGHPIVTALRKDCRIMMRLADGSVWSSAAIGHINRKGERMVRETEQIDRARYGQQCGLPGPAPDSGTFSQAAVDEAAADGVPYIAAAFGGTGCHAELYMPNGRKYGVDSPGLRVAGGDELNGRLSMIGCTPPPAHPQDT